MAKDASTILLRKDIIGLLKEAKEYERQTYNELIEKMSKMFIELKKRNKYDEFLHKVQQPKVRELWDNSDDEVWDNV
jgi:hypothetical protein